MSTAILPLVTVAEGRWPLALRVMGAAEARRDAPRLLPTHQLSLLEADRLPPSLDDVPSHQRLNVAFGDVTDPRDPMAATMDQLHAIIAWVDQLPATARLIIHCHAGLGRSPAIALGLLARVAGPTEAARILKRIRPRALPNRHIVGLFDAELEFAGQLRAASAAQFSLGNDGRSHR